MRVPIYLLQYDRSRSDLKLSRRKVVDTYPICWPIVPENCTIRSTDIDDIYDFPIRYTISQYGVRFSQVPNNNDFLYGFFFILEFFFMYLHKIRPRGMENNFFPFHLRYSERLHTCFSYTKMKKYLNPVNV